LDLLHPGLAAAGLAAIAIPIIIHLLFRRRRRPVPWAAMRFLLEAYRRARRRMRLERWLLLAIRVLAVALMGLALARPLLDGGGLLAGAGGVEGRRVYLLVDDGLASGLRDEPATDRTALDRHRETAHAVIDRLGPADRVSVVRLSRPAEALIDPPTGDRAVARRVLDELAPSDARTELAAGLEGVGETLAATEDDPSAAIVVLLTDWRRGSVDLDAPRPDFDPPVGAGLVLRTARPAERAIPNVQVAAVEPVRRVALAGAGDGGGQVTARLRRTGPLDQVATTSVRILAAELPGVADEEARIVRWDPGQGEASVDFRLDPADVEAGTIALEVRIAPDLLASDDVRHEIVEVRDALRVAVLDRRDFGTGGGIDRLSSGQWLRRALDPGGDAERIVVETVDPATIDPLALRRADAALLPRPDLVTTAGWSALAEYAASGGVVWLMPAADQTVGLWTDAAASAFGLPWRWAREVVEFESPEASEATTGRGFALEQPRSVLLGMIDAELPDLLPIVEGLDPADVLLRLAPASPGGENEETADPDGDAASTAFMVATSGPGERGLVVYASAPPHLDWTSLPVKPFMVALVQETIRQAVGEARQEGRSAQPGDAASALASSAAVSARAPGGTSIAWATGASSASTEGDGGQRFGEAGTWTMLDLADRPIRRIAVNPDPDAGRTETATEAAVLAWLGGSGDGSDADGPETDATGRWSWIDGAAAERGGTDEAGGSADAASADDLLGLGDEARSDAAFVLLVLVALLVAAETVLARYFSHAARSDVGIGDGEAGPDLGAYLHDDAGGTGLRSTLGRFVPGGDSSSTSRGTEGRGPA